MSSESDLTIVRATSIHQIEPSIWDGIVPDEDIVNSHAYLSAVERSGLPGLQYRYFQMFRGPCLLANATVSLFTFSLDVMVGGVTRRLLNVVRPVLRRFLRATVVECGHPTALGSSLVVASQEDLPAVLPALDVELVRLATEAGTSLIDLRDVYASDRTWFDELLKRGYRIMPNMANTYFRVYQNSFKEYLADLVAKRRYEILRRLRIYQDLGGTVEKVTDFAGMADQLETLWRNTYRQAKEYQREILNAAYFRHMSDALGDRSFILACWKGERLLGFTMMLDSGDTLISTYCGLDYTVNRSMYVYFVLFYRSIEEAIALKKTWLELGVTNYNPKMEVGAVPKPMYIYAKSTRPVVNVILTRLLTLFNRPPEFNKRRIFNSRFYQRHRTQRETTAAVAGRLYRVRDVSLEGIGLEGDERVESRRVRIDVHDQDGAYVQLSGKLCNAARTDDNTWRMGFRVRTASPDFVPMWHNLVQRKAAAGETDG